MTSSALKKEISFITLLAAGGFYLSGRKRAALALGAAGLALRVLPQRLYSYAGRVVMITGGSRGLGLAMARLLAKDGARVALIARNEEELQRAKAQLVGLDAVAPLMVTADVTAPDQLKEAFEKIRQHFGRIDVLINNAGAIEIGPFKTMKAEDFKAQMDLHLHAIVQSTQLALPYFAEVGGGRIVNISSIGGKIPVPHMTAYSASKFALAGFSKSVAAELANENISVSTVYPGLMRTGSPVQAGFKGDHEKEYAWFATADSMPLLSVEAETAARIILERAAAGDAEILFSLPARFGDSVQYFFPELTAFFLRVVNRLLPSGTSEELKTGAESSSWWRSQFWTKPLQVITDRAAADLNEITRYDAETIVGLKH